MEQEKGKRKEEREMSTWRSPSSLFPRSFFLFPLLLSCASPRPQVPTPPAYSVTGIVVATLPQFRVRSLISDADTSRRLDIPVFVWALRRPGAGTVLIDAGFHHEKFLRQWKPEPFVRPDSALRLAEIDPASVTDIIITHIHWDHADGIDRFPAARVWLQRQEYEYYVSPNGTPLQPGIDSLVAAELFRRRQNGTLRLVDGSGTEILPGVRVHTGGKHTYASQYVSVRTASGTIVIASDNAYLYENLERRVAIAQTLDAASNVNAQGDMLTLAGSWDRVVPGHDPAILKRFAEVRSGVVRLTR